VKGSSCGGTTTTSSTSPSLTWPRRRLQWPASNTCSYVPSPYPCFLNETIYLIRAYCSQEMQRGSSKFSLLQWKIVHDIQYKVTSWSQSCFPVYFCKKLIQDWDLGDIYAVFIWSKKQTAQTIIWICDTFTQFMSLDYISLWFFFDVKIFKYFICVEICGCIPSIC
jgi:hypothetical protein